MITKLTPQQEKQIPIFIDKFIKLAEKPTNREEATLAVQNLYENANQDKPIVIFGRSPLETVVMVAMCKTIFKEGLIKDDSQLNSQLRSQLHSQLNSQLRSQLNSQLDSQLHSQLDSQLRSQLDSQLHSQLYSQLDSQLYSQLHSQLNSQLYSQLRSQLNSQLKNINNDWWLIIWWLVWTSWYSFGEYIGVKFDSKILKIFMDFVTNVSFMIPYKGIAFVSETPIKINWENKMLSCSNAPAVEYADGYSLYSINGVRFTEEQFKKSQKANLEDIISWEDIDQRSALLSKTPLEKLLKKVDKKIIDETKECGGYKLYEIKLKDIGKARLLSYKSWTTDKTYAKFVPPTSEKCLETVASLRHQTVEELINSYKS